MGELEFLFEFVVAIAVLTVPVVVGIRVLAGDESARVPRCRAPEDDLNRWNLEVLDRGRERRGSVGKKLPVGRQALPLSR